MDEKHPLWQAGVLSLEHCQGIPSSSHAPKLGITFFSNKLSLYCAIRAISSSFPAVWLSSADNSRNAVPAEDRTCSNPTIILELFRCCFRNYSPPSLGCSHPLAFITTYQNKESPGKTLRISRACDRLLGLSDSQNRSGLSQS